VGSGFKEPAFEENFNTGFSTGNPALNPERSRSWEIGLEQSVAGGQFLFSGTYFSQQFRDLVQYTFTPATPGGPNYFNVAAADASGIELSERTALAAGVTLEGSYTYLHTEVTNSGFDSGPDATFVSGERLLRRPSQSATGRVSWAFARRATVGAAVHYVGDRSDRDFGKFPSPRVVLPSYLVLDASGQVDVLPGSPGFTLSWRVENLMDQKYSEIANFPARGRTVMVGGRLRL
jgi:vitamin B12 transporter